MQRILFSDGAVAQQHADASAVSKDADQEASLLLEQLFWLFKLGQESRLTARVVLKLSASFCTIACVLLLVFQSAIMGPVGFSRSADNSCLTVTL